MVRNFNHLGKPWQVAAQLLVACGCPGAFQMGSRAGIVQKPYTWGGLELERGKGLLSR
jgi:hypothetical protein